MIDYSDPITSYDPHKLILPCILSAILWGLILGTAWLLA